jgi:hypothetical protein
LSNDGDQFAPAGFPQLEKLGVDHLAMVDINRWLFIEMSFKKDALVSLVLIPANEPTANRKIILAQSKPYFFM